MRRFVVIVSALLMSLTLTACGNSHSERAEDNISREYAATEPVSNIDADEETAVESTVITTAEEVTESEATEKSDTDTDILIAFFSRADENYNVGTIEKGNTQVLAEMIYHRVGGELYHIETVTPYPADYDSCTDIAKQEQNDNARPELSTTVADFDNYDVIFLGYPIWWGDMPMAVYTFLESYDFSGKTIIPFSTHEGSGIAGTDSNIADACSDATVLDYLSMKGSTAQDSRDEAKEQVDEWLTKLGY